MQNVYCFHNFSLDGILVNWNPKDPDWLIEYQPQTTLNYSKMLRIYYPRPIDCNTVELKRKTDKAR